MLSLVQYTIGMDPHNLDDLVGDHLVVNDPSAYLGLAVSAWDMPWGGIP